MKKSIIVLISVLALYSCKKSEQSSNVAADMANANTQEESSDLSSNVISSYRSEPDQKLRLSSNNAPVAKYISSSAAVVNPLDTSRKLIVKADLKFKVQDVTQATYKIEDLIKKEGGFVTSSELTSSDVRTETMAISADSTLESKHHTMTNYMTVRVPNTQLDTTLKQIARLIDYLDYRNINVEDVAIQLKINKWRQGRYQGSARRITKVLDGNTDKVNASMNAEEALLNSQQQEEQAITSTMELQDQIRFSTIKLTLYQRPSVYRELIANEANIDEYQPGYGLRLLDSILAGWYFLGETVLVIVKLWWLLAIIGLIYWGIVQYRHYFKK